MRRTTALAMVVLALFAFAGCSKKDDSSTPNATPTPKADPPGGEHKMKEAIVTKAGSRVVVIGWAKGSPKRPEAPGPGQVYETIGVGFCAGPNVQVTGRELVHLFSLELPNGNRVAPDSLTGKLELRSKGAIEPGHCTRGPIVFQVGGGTKPSFVVFESDPETKWKVP
jgi:hypothetical protein